MEYILQKRASDEVTVREEIMPKLLKKMYILHLREIKISY